MSTVARNQPRRVARTRTTNPIDLLEPRRLFAAFSGTETDDVFEMFRSSATTMRLVINGVSLVTSDARVTINGGGGNDELYVHGMPSIQYILFRGGDGNDRLSNIGGDLDAAYATTFEFEGNAGFDEVIADNSSDETAPAEIEINSNLAIKNFIALFAYYEIESIIFHDSNGSNVIRFGGLQGPQQDIALWIGGNGGHDFIENFGDYLPTAIGTLGVGVDGGGGTDTLALSDAFDLFATYTIDSASFTFDAPFSSTGPVGFSTIEAFELLQTPNNDITEINGKPVGMSLRVETGNGDDQVICGGGDIDNGGFRVANTTILAGAGNDSIRFDDVADTEIFGEVDTYTFENSSLAKGQSGFSYGGFETQRLDLGDGQFGSFPVGSTVLINALSGFIEHTQINGGSVRDNFVNVGNGNLTNLSGGISIDLGAAGGVINVRDQLATVARDFQMNATQFTQPRVINFAGADQINISAGSGDDTLHVSGVPAGTNVNFNGNSGNEYMALVTGSGGGVIAANVTVNGNGGEDQVYINHSAAGGAPTNAVMTQTTFTAAGEPVLRWGTAESVTVVPGATGGGSNLDIRATTVPTTIQGSNGGDDTITIGNSDLYANITGNIHVNGNNGNDSIVFDDDASTDPFSGYAFDRLDGADRFLRAGGSGTRIISAFSLENRTLHANNGGSGVEVYDTTTTLRINANGGNDGIFVHDTSAPVTISSGTGLDFLQVGDFSVNATPTAIFDADDELAGMSIRSGTVRVESDAVLCNLGITRNAIGEPVIGGTLDLAGGAYLGRPGEFALTQDQIRAMLIRGRNGGAWNGTSPQGVIHSELAAASSAADSIGYGLGSQIAPTTIGSFVIGADDALVRHTLDGDADLSGAVSLADFNRLAAQFGQPNRVWTDGDFNYDGSTTLADFNLLATNFGQAPLLRTGSGPFQSATRIRELVEL